MDRKQMVRDLMLRTEMARKRRIHPVWGEMGLIAGQPRVLCELAVRDHITQKELADRSCIEPATLSRALDRLEAMGYIVRNDNPRCRRSFLISLTETGRETAAAVQKRFQSLEGEMMEGFTDEELDSLCELLGRILKNLDDKFHSPQERRKEDGD